MLTVSFQISAEQRKKLIAVLKEVVRYADFWKADLENADLVYCYLFPDLLSRLEKKLEQELRNGCSVISCNYPLPNWKPYKVISANDLDPVYLYTFQGI